MTATGLGIREEILVRLQVNDLIRCKSVCKSWYSLISTPRFAKSQLNYNLNKKVDNNEIGNTRINSLAATRSCNDKEYLVGSSNGLVCVSRYATDFLVVNPSTHEMKRLRNPPVEYNSRSASGLGFRYGSSIDDYKVLSGSGFGYDSSIDDYKVVIGFFNYRTKETSYKVLSLKSNIWRSVDVEWEYGLRGTGILCNGALHWYAFRGNELVIVSFDLSKEILKEIAHPKLNRSEWVLGTMNDCLCIIGRPTINYKYLQIWVMRSYNVQESWERKLPPPGYDTRKPLMSYAIPMDIFNSHLEIWLLEEGSGAPVFVQSIRRCRLENLIDYYPHIRLCTNSECNYNYDEHVYVKSLVSPHGMVDRDGHGDSDRGDCNIDDVISLSTLFL